MWDSPNAIGSTPKFEVYAVVYSLHCIAWFCLFGMGQCVLMTPVRLLNGMVYVVYGIGFTMVYHIMGFVAR